MIRHDYIPAADADAAVWMEQFAAAATSLGATIGLSPAEVAEIESLVSAYRESLEEQRLAVNQARAATARKDEQRAESDAGIRRIVRGIQAFPGTNDGMRALLGVSIAKPRTTPHVFTPHNIFAKVVGAAQIDLSWESGGNARGTSFRVDRKIGGGAWESLVLTTRTRCTVAVTSYEPTSFRVRAQRNLAESSTSNVVTVFADETIARIAA